MRISLFTFLLSSYLLVNSEKRNCIISNNAALKSMSILSIIGDEKLNEAFKEHVNQHCAIMRFNLKKLFLFAKCQSQQAKRICFLLVKGLHKSIKKRCRSQKWKEEFHRFGSCYGKKEVISGIKKCVKQANISFKQIIEINNNDTDQVIPMSCCVSKMATECIRTRVTSFCNPKFGNFSVSLFREPIEEALNAICGSKNITENCFNPNLINLKNNQTSLKNSAINLTAVIEMIERSSNSSHS